MDKVYIGVDIGSVSINIVAINKDSDLVFRLYKRNTGQPVDLVKEGFQELREELGDRREIGGIGVTGSGRQLTAYVLGADLVKNEITAHAAATTFYYPNVGTIFEIGGQDSKLIIIKNGIPVDFAMNTVCAAGTGSFLDHQAIRLGVKIEEFGRLALQAKRDVRIAGRCTVFAESDMISKQQYGYTKAEIIKGLSRALVRNYMNNLVRGKQLEGQFIFQGGVAANVGIKAAFEEELQEEVIVPEHYDVMGAIGIALLAKEEMERSGRKSAFRGLDFTQDDFFTDSFNCTGCANECEVIRVMAGEELIAITGDRCGKWSASIIDKKTREGRNYTRRTANK